MAKLDGHAVGQFLLRMIKKTLLLLVLSLACLLARARSVRACLCLDLVST